MRAWKVSTADEHTYRLAQVWQDTSTRNTYFLATTKGRLVRPLDVCMEMEHYAQEPLKGLLIVREGPVVLETFYCSICKRAQLKIQDARIAYDEVEALSSRMQEGY